MENIKQKLGEEGWTFEDFRCYKRFSEYEIDIEFCMGDFCVGIYNEDLNLLEPKIRCENFIEAYLNAVNLIEKYGQHDSSN